MSIYPVKLIEWYPFSKNYDDNRLSESARIMVKYTKCVECNRGGIKFHKAYGHHSLPWGYGDVWCSWKCFRED